MDGEERDIKGDTFNFPIYKLSFLPLQLFYTVPGKDLGLGGRGAEQVFYGRLPQLATLTALH